LNAKTNKTSSPGASTHSGTVAPINPELTFTIFPSVNKTWGYNIYMEKRLYIHQPSIPGLPGNDGFKTKTSAEKVAKLVIGKVQKGEMPPTVTVEELKKLKVL